MRSFVRTKQRHVKIYISVNNLKAVNLLSKEIDEDGVIVGSPVVGRSVGVDGNDRLLDLLRHSVGIHNLHVTVKNRTYIHWRRSVTHVRRTARIPGLYEMSLPPFPKTYGHNDPDGPSSRTL